MAGALHDPGSLVIRRVGIADVDRNPCFSHREHCVLMKHAGAHIGKLAQLTVCDRLDRLRILDDARICNEKARHIRPVLIAGGMYRTRHDGSRDVGTASGKGLDRSVRQCPVESRNYRTLAFLQTLCQHLVGLLRVKSSVLLEENYLCRIHKLVAKVIRHNDTVQIFAAGRRIVNPRFIFKVLTDLFEFFLQ